MARLLLDEGLPLRAAPLLRLRGLDAVHCREVGLAAASDPAILDFARRENRTCVTLDHDFHGLLAATAAIAPSVVFIRAQKLGFEEAADLIARIAEQTDSHLLAGAAVTATRKTLRVRLLPLT